MKLFLYYLWETFKADLLNFFAVGIVLIFLIPMIQKQDWFLIFLCLGVLLINLGIIAICFYFITKNK
jgi:hypothetical protein